jgi:hypothetical protein
VEIGDEKSAYRFKSDATFHIQIGDQSKLAKGENTGLSKEATSETLTKIEVKPEAAEANENPV